MQQNLPDPEYLQKRLRYCNGTGRLFWLDNPSRSKSWRTRYAGKEAFATIGAGGYLQGNLDGRQLYAHRTIWAIVYGMWPKGEIDHIDHNRKNNLISNLRDVSRVENGRNLSIRKGNTSGIPGVKWSKRLNKWVAQIMVDNRAIHLGLFPNISDAIMARSMANKKYGFHINHGM